jgi:hypothetical protein
MKVNPLPPQAYTKETLQKAYTWLLNQSASVKDLATTQDMLISLYLKAQRSGDASLETPSIQNFKQELKNLATMIGDLQTPSSYQVQNSAPIVQPPPAPPAASTNASLATNPPLQSPAPAPTISNSPTPMTTPTPKVVTQNNSSLNSGSGASSNSGSNSSSSSSLGQLDLQSLQILSDVRHNLNLSSDIEALRMLITLGYRQIKKMRRK